MGLDLVEYVIAIEDAFEIAIPDTDAARLDTPGKLVDYLCNRLGETPDGPPLIQTAFYRLRAAISDELGIVRSNIRPSSTIADLTGKSEKDVWKAVASRLDVSMKVLSHAPVARWLAKFVRARDRTVGDVAMQIAMVRPAVLKRHSARWTRAQVTEVVTRLLEYETGLTIGTSQLNATFVRDLGMG